MPGPTRWTKEARQAIVAMITAQTPRATIEKVTGMAWRSIAKTLAYHAQQEALAQRRLVDPAYANLVIVPPLHAVEHDRCVDGLYAPKVPLPAHLQKYAGRKAYG